MGAHRAGGWGASRVPIPDGGLRKGLGREGASRGRSRENSVGQGRETLGSVFPPENCKMSRTCRRGGGSWTRRQQPEQKGTVTGPAAHSGSQPWCNPRVTWGTLKKYQCPALTQELLSQKGVGETRRASLDFLKLLGDSNGQPGLRAPELEP